MSNVVSMERTCEYLYARARRHRLAGRYGEAMTLLTRAKEQFGSSEAIEMEMARIYDEMGCEEEALRCYLRVVRAHGKEEAQALFSLAVSAMQRGDFRRAQSYMNRFILTDQKGVEPEMVQLFAAQMDAQIHRTISRSRKARARALEHRAVERLQQGKASAAERNMRHALTMRDTAQGRTLLACCLLLKGNAEEAITQAQAAHKASAGRLQTLCVLADAYLLAGEDQKAKKTLYLAMLRARDMDDLFHVAIESAKRGEDGLTLLLTRRLLRREPYHTRAMMLRACALCNLGRIKEANRILGRLCALTPEDTVCDALYRMTREENVELERLTLGIEVPRQEAVARTMHLFTALYRERGEEMDVGEQRTLCRYCAWALRSTLAGPRTAVIALILLQSLDTPMAQETLLDALTDPQLPDELKIAILQILTEKYGILPYEADIDGQFVRLTAGAQVDCPPSETGQQVVQQAADMLSDSFPDASSILLPIWVKYLNRFGAPKGRHADACAAALVYLFHEQKQNPVQLSTIAGCFGVSKRLCALMLRRIRRAQEGEAGNQQEETP